MLYPRFTYQRPYVVCNMHDSEGKKVSMGIARCSKTDNYSPKIGSKIALMRALIDGLENKIAEIAGDDLIKHSGWGSDRDACCYVARLLRESGWDV